MHADQDRTNTAPGDGAGYVPRPDPRSGPRSTQYMDGAGATGRNTAYGNMPNNQGMRLGDPAPFPDEKQR